MNATPQRENVFYTVDERIFSDANRVQTRREKDSLYALEQDASVTLLDVTAGPGESLSTSATFLSGLAPVRF